MQTLWHLAIKLPCVCLENGCDYYIYVITTVPVKHLVHEHKLQLICLPYIIRLYQL